MNIKSQEAVLARLPENATQAWTTGRTWAEEYPEEGSWMGDVAKPLRREGADTWERRSIESRITVTKGALIERFYSVDARGSRALRRAPTWGSDRHRSVREKLSPARRPQRWRGYWEWVAETGRDPIGEFPLPDTARCGWRLLCQETKEGVLVRYARRLESARPLRTGTDYRRRGALPRRLRDFCRLEEGLIHPGAVERRSDLARRFRRRDTGRIAGRQILDSERRRVPDDHGPLETLPGAFFVDVTIEEPIPQERRRKTRRMKAEEKIRAVAP